MSFNTALLNSAIADVASILTTFATDPLFAKKFALAFSTTLSSEQFLQIVAVLPEIEVLADDELQGALGAFSAQTQKIYLSESLLKGDLVKLRSVLIEEIGHYLDAQVNSVDSPGDEGAIFAAVVLGQELSASQLALIKTEDDHGVINLNGKAIEVEQSTGANLVITNVTSPATALLGQTISLSWTVKNQGTIATTSSSWVDTVYYSKDDVFGNSDDVSLIASFISSDANLPLDPNETYTITQNIAIPNSIAGSGYLLFKTDSYSYYSQTETNEQDNVYSLAIDITAPNLVISNPTAPPTSAILGETIAVSWQVSNTGTVSANGYWYDYVYLSNDDKFDSSDTYLTYVWTENKTPLAAGTSYTISQNITLPSSAGVGNRYLLFVADRDNYQGEISETDNVVGTPITLSAPDLIVPAATASETGVARGTVNVSWTVKNQGTISVPIDWYDSVYLSTDSVFNYDDLSLGLQSIPPQTLLVAGGSYTIDSSVPLPNVAPGNYYLLFNADSGNAQGETDETNNVRAVAITVTAPDLVVSAATVPTNGIANGTIAVSYTVTNQSNVASATGWYDTVYLSTDATFDYDYFGSGDTYLGGQYISSPTSLGEGESYTKDINLTLPNRPAGDYYLFFLADRNNDQYETDETNNNRAVPITIGVPDLSLSEATAPTSRVLGESVSLSWKVTNSGSVTAPADWIDRVYFSLDNVWDNSDSLVASESITTQTPLTAGNNYSISKNFILSNQDAIGSGYLLFVTDADQTQTETSETNNVQAVAFTLNAPDLVVSDITVPVEIISGQSVEITWTDKNQGTGTATGTWYDYVYLENQNGGQNYNIGTFEFVGSLAVGESIERSQTITLPIQLQGNYKVVVTTNYYDYYNDVLEGTQNESNNTTTDDRLLQVKLAPIPNLQVSSVTAPLTAFSSQSTAIQWTVKNVGNGATSSPYWSDSVYLSLDNTFDDTDIYLGQANNPSYLNAGDSYTNHLDVTLPRGISGNYYFLVKTDVLNNVFENDQENDNLTVGGPTNVSLTPPPDFQVTNVTTLSQAFSGQSLNISWTVINQGLGKNRETFWYDQVFLSTDEILDAGDRNLGAFSQNGTLNSNDSYTISQTVSLPIGISGDYYFFVQTDAGNQVYENVFDGNNTAHKATPTRINLTPPPDLEIASLTAPTQATGSRTLNFSYQVTNFGSTTTPNAYWTDRFYLSLDNQLDPNTDLHISDQYHYGSLAPDESYTNNFSYTLPDTLTGNYYLFGVTDGNNEVFELNNENNAFLVATPITITSQPADLVVLSASAPTTGEAGKALRVEWTVRNQGIGDTAVSSWTDQVILSQDAQIGNGDDLVIGAFSRGEILAPNQSYTRSELVTLPIDAIAGYQVFVVTDARNSVYEATQENNNSSIRQPLTVTRETADLQVTQVSSPSSGQSGQALTVNWTVKNFGSSTTNINYWYDGVYLSTDNQISSDDIFLGYAYRSEALAASEQYSVSRSFNLPNNLQAGNYYTLVRTDVYNYIYEGSLENNNDKATEGTTAGTSIGITASPDLVMVSVDAPTTAISGQNLTVSWTVRNAGTVETGDRSWYEAFYLSRDQVFDRSSDTYLGYSYYTSNLAAGATYSRTESFRLPQGISGPFYLFAQTDAGNGVYEGTAENNNVAYDPNSVAVSLAQPADLVAGTITIPANGVTGQNGSITYTVTNEGSNAVVGNWSDSLYLSKDGQWDINDLFLGQVGNSGEVLSGDSYTNTVTASLPGVVQGDYQVIIRSDIRNQIPESNESNNLKATLDKVNVDMERLTMGTPSTGTLAQGQGVYYT